jgi:hypothetical protein
MITQIGTNLVRYLRGRRNTLAATARDWDSPASWQDPMSHPDIRSMSARELADLPFDRTYVAQHTPRLSHPRRWL